MKKAFTLMIAACAFITFSASAQTMSGKSGKMGMEKQYLIDSMKLSSTVADSVISIRSQARSQIKNIMKDQTLSDDQKKEKVKPIKQEMKTRLAQYLSKDQIAKLQDMRGDMKKSKEN
ncbi:MAG: hypothetical protein JST21_13555 [Bacteroidetes bacterium]|nr:hypothetical protein [Bacteroidota bacterium]